MKRKNLLLIKTMHLIPLLIFAAGWEIAARLAGTPLFPPLSTVLQEFYTLLLPGGLLAHHFTASLIRVLAGFVMGSAAGLLLGILTGWNRIAERLLGPLASVLYPIPALGWLPLLMLWVGINEMLPILIVFICSFFPIFYNTTTGIKSVDERYIKAARVLGGSDSQILWLVVLPLALPNIFTGLKLEAGMAWRVIIAAEMVAIPTGIGVLLMKAESLIRVDIIMVCLLVLSLMCFSFERLFHYLETKFTCLWRS